MKSLLISFTLLAGAMRAQQVPVLKIEDLLKRIGNNDTVYVVNFWATWCKPCIQELPAFDSLQAANTGKKFRMLMVSLDFAEDLQGRVLPFLKKNHFNFDCVLLDETNGNDFINRIDRRWSGAIPATLIRQGESQQFLEKKLRLSELQVLCFP